MKKIIIMLGIASMAWISVTAQTNTQINNPTGTTPQTSGNTAAGTTLPGSNNNSMLPGNSNSTIVPGGYQAPNGSYPRVNQQNSLTPTFNNTNTNSTISPNATMPGNTPTTTTPPPNLNTGTNPIK